MSMRLLLDGNFNHYFDPQRTKGALWLFQHVPKTAGSSLREEIAGALRENRPATNIHVDGMDLAIPFHDRLDRAVEDFATRCADNSYRFASGHIFARHVARIRAAAPQTRLFTYLRDPVSRFISDYRYQRSPMHPGHEAFRREVPTIEAFLARGWTANQMTQYLLPLDHLLDTFEFVGLQDDYDTSFRILTRLIGIQREPSLRERTNPPTQDNPADIDPTLAARIEAAHAFDRSLFEELRRRLDMVKDDLAAWILQRAA
ncbi:sulfotransferase family 2 domain-containing protein [Roseomonas sp. HJA6]|uniref:Sulfotransferase family 2 domain-containing protein n=1 Tax=Roseomonas alba TaxID=2846776 RepID=A0ABS7A311_9PROT|nr:sulfotransferase family 2 domain-containing protein [Neoroseomonas alba]MBW6396659.1 sulfotransferase family 2 domain-containing protein [Neoroseomonas alba]